MKKTQFNGIGLMSGTSLDGLDIAYCSFKKSRGEWNYKIKFAETIKYPEEIASGLKQIAFNDAQAYAEFDIILGSFFGMEVNKFIDKFRLKPDFISSHGHTIFHQPHKGFTAQIGSGAAIASITGIETVCNFRVQDVVLGGQGAPLVPVGDALLFKNYTHCLNLGGIANISYTENKKRIASDLCFCNIALNYLANQANKSFDKDGRIAAKGHVNNDLLKKLLEAPFNKKKFPKSLGREDFEREILPNLTKSRASLSDKMRTMIEYIVTLIGRAGGINEKQSTILITGGGAFNSFLIKQMQERLKCTIHIPDQKIVGFKEALIFAFLGLLRIENEINVLKSVTGATSNTISGAVYSGSKK